MCKRHSPYRIDKCMKHLIKTLQKEGLETLSCCCGHGKYPKTVVARIDGHLIYEIFSSERLPRKKRFYNRDKEGYYYIPETIKNERTI